MLKKLIATSAAAAVVASQIATGLVYGAPVVTDPEMIDSVSWGYDAGLTKYSGTDTFMPYANLTREQFAKFASEFGTSVLGLDAVGGADCSFSDLGTADSTLADSITNACSLGLMMGHNGKFMPKQEVTRGQVATVVSRMLGEIDPMSSEQAHFELLNSKGIMKYAMLNQSILRGDMMLMLYRLAINNNGLCDIDPTLCNNGNGTTTGGVIVVKEGNLNISMNSSSPANLSSVPSSGTVKYATVDFTAGSKDIMVNSITLKRSGLGSSSDFSRVYFEKDGIRVSSRASVGSDNSVVLSFAPAWVIKAGTSESVDLYADMTASVGSENMFQSTNINSSAANVVGMITTPTLRAASYNVATVTFVSAGAGLTSTASDATDLELGQFRLTASSNSSDIRDLLFKSVTLRQDGTADLTSLSDLGLYRNGVKISTVAVSNGKDVTFGLGAGDTLKDGQSAVYYVRGTVNYVDGVNGDTYKFRLRNTTDLNVNEVTTAFRAQVSGNNVSLNTYTVNGADVQFKRDSSFALSSTISPGTVGAVLLKGTITSKTPIYLEDISLPFTAQGGATASSIAKRYTLTIGNSVFTWNASATTGLSNATFDGSVALNGSADVMLTADVDTSTATGGSIKFGPLQLSSFSTKEYQNNQNTISGAAAVGTIDGATISIVTSKLNITRNDGISSKTIVQGAKNQLIYGATFSTSQNNAIRVNSFTLSGGNTFDNNLTLTLYDANGNAVKTATYRNGVATFFGLNLLVSKTTPQAWTVKGDFNDGVTGALQLTLTGIDAVDTVTSNSITVAGVQGGAITVNGSANVNISVSSSLQSQMLYANQANVTLAQFTLESKKDAVNITDLYLKTNGAVSGNISNKINNIQLTDGTNTWFGTVRNGMIAFENMSSSTIALDQIKTFTLKGDISNLTSSGDVTTGFTFAFDNNTADQTAGTASGIRAVSQSNGQLVTLVNGSTTNVSPTTQINKGTLTVSKTAVTPTTSEFARFDIQAKGNKVQISGFDMSLINVTGGNTGNIVNVYKDGLGGTLMYSGVVGTGLAVAGRIVFNQSPYYVEITAGNSVTFSVKVVNPIATLNGTTANPMGIDLGNVYFTDVLDDGNVYVTNTSTYKNTGSFPFTWSQ